MVKHCVSSISPSTPICPLQKGFFIRYKFAYFLDSRDTPKMQNRFGATVRYLLDGKFNLFKETAFKMTTIINPN
jgi:hypothetical protein